MSHKFWNHKLSFNLIRGIGWGLALGLTFDPLPGAGNSLMAVEGSQADLRGRDERVDRQSRNLSDDTQIAYSACAAAGSSFFSTPAQDRERHPGWKKLEEGQKLLGQRTEESLRLAAQKFEEALQIWRSSRNRNGEAAALSGLGEVHIALGEYQKGIDYFTKALPALRESEPRLGEGLALFHIGIGYDGLGEKLKAIDYYAQSLRPLRAVGKRKLESIALGRTANLYRSMGENLKAFDFYNQTLAVNREIGDREGEAVTLRNIGSLYEAMGEKQKALDFYRQADAALSRSRRE
jgi:tetratricopeptide (TPR) repeat protein